MSNLARMAVDEMSIGFLQSRNINGPAALAALALAAITAVISLSPPRDAWAKKVPNVDARVVAMNIPGASAVAQIGTFLNVPPPGACANPIPSKFPSYIQPGAVLDPNRILAGTTSNFGAPRAIGVGRKAHSCPSIRAEPIS
jgi:hypothetical protein